MEHKSPLETEEKQRILCLDPDSDRRRETCETLNENGFTVMGAGSLGDALEILALHEIHVVITEILMPGMEPMDILRAIRRQEESPVILILTGQKERRLGRDRRLGQIFEYLTSPVPPHQLVAHVRRACSFYREKLASLDMRGDSESRMRNQLEWLVWKERSRQADKIQYGRTMIENIKNSISQGMGVGGLVTFLEILRLAAEEEGDFYRVKREALDSLFHTGDFVRGWLNNLEAITHAFSREFVPGPMDAKEFSEIIRRSVHEVEEFRNIKNQRVNVSKIEFPVPVLGNPEALELVTKELLVNAYKYSPEGSSVDITCFRTGNSVSLLVMNDIIPMAGGIAGIPQELENDLFEPFFKLNQYYDERYYKEDFGMGIGLTVIQNAMYQVGGKIHIFEVTDHATEERPRKRVVAELLFTGNPESQT